MNEISHGSLLPEQDHPSWDGSFRDRELTSGQEATRQTIRQEAAELREAQEAWLERRGLLEDTPRLTMTNREFWLFGNAGLDNGDATTSYFITTVREKYGIPSHSKYALVEIVSGNDTPQITRLVAVDETDFGTAFDEWPEEITSADIPRLTMKPGEYILFMNAGIGDSRHIQYAREIYDIPQGDQYGAQYALIEIVDPDNPIRPNEPLLVDVTESDFGTVIERETIEMDLLNPNPSPDSPPSPESEGAYIIVNIAENLARSDQGLQNFTLELMKGVTNDPFLSYGQDIRIRAGDPSGNPDAYVWEVNPFTNAVALTIAFPGQYDSVCVVSGQRQEPANGKPRMAQIKNPLVVLKIEGEALKKLQEIYLDLYAQPDFAITKEQNRERDRLFNEELESLIRETTRNNRNAEARRRQRQRSLTLRQMPLPGSDTPRDRWR